MRLTEDEILDFVPPEEGKTLFTNLALVFVTLTIVLIIFTGLLIPETVLASQTLNIPKELNIIKAFLRGCIFLGSVCSYLAYYKQEDSRYLKFLGALINFTLAILIVAFKMMHMYTSN